MNWMKHTPQQVAAALDTDLKAGLTSAEAEERLDRNGPNRLAEGKKRTLFRKFMEQFKDFMIIILIIAAVVSVIATKGEDWIDSVIILAVVVLNAVLGVAQESKAEKSVEALKKMSAPFAKVIRDGQRLSVPAEQVVVGDVIVVEAGDLVPADARLIESANLKIEESALTGESVPVEKHTHLIDKDEVPLGDMKNMIFSTSVVTYGRGVAVVTATAMDTQVGKIAKMLDNEGNEPTPLQIKLAQIGKFLGFLAIGICVVIVALGLIEGRNWIDMFMTAVSLAVAAIPEGLPAVVTIVLAIGVQRLVKRNAIIRRLPAVETLGSASVICSDKTGTLTQNRMTVVRTYVHGEVADFAPTDEGNQTLIRYAALCNDGKVTVEEGKEHHIGDPTETALVAAALKAEMEKDALDTAYIRVQEIPFDSDRKMMTTIHQVEDGYLSITKGAPDVVLARCQDEENILSAATEANSQMGRAALRVLAVGVRHFDTLPERVESENIETELSFVGLIGMIDPPRLEVKDSVKMCQQAGIKPVMITGDHIETASAIAAELGILAPGDRAVSGVELNQMSDEELAANIRNISVYARVAPEHKVRIVNAWQSVGEIVAMTGDGVNDAPALKSADIGCAMGITGTDVAKGAAHMVLTDDNFSTIVVAVKEGRGIYQNIKKCVQFLLSSNLGEICTIFVAMLCGWSTPLVPIHLLWVNLVTDSLPALALGTEPVEEGVMNVPPRKKNEGFFAHGFGWRIALQGVMIGALALAAFVIGRLMTGLSLVDSLNHPEADAGTTMAFGVLAISQLFHAFNVKSSRTLFGRNLINNKALIGAFAAGIALQLGVMLIPPVREIFKLVALTGTQWAIVFGLALCPVVIMEFAKLIQRLMKRK